MKLRSALVSVLVLAGGTLCWAGPAEDAAAVFSKGAALLAKADFDGALKAFTAAAKTDPSNMDYRNQYSILKRVITMREGLAKEKNPEKWKASALALRSYYHSNKIYNEALALDSDMHARLNSAESAGMLAQTQLAMGKPDAAEKTLSALDDKSATPETQILKGIALARQGKTEQARTIADKLALPDDAGPGLLYNAACLKSLAGDLKGAQSLLTKSFESTPPSRLDGMKTAAREDKDLAATVASAGFADVVKTASKVKESKCSGGSSCGSCPSKGKCSVGGDKPAAGCTEKH